MIYRFFIGLIFSAKKLTNQHSIQVLTSAVSCNYQNFLQRLGLYQIIKTAIWIFLANILLLWHLPTLTFKTYSCSILHVNLVFYIDYNNVSFKTQMKVFLINCVRPSFLFVFINRPSGPPKKMLLEDSYGMLVHTSFRNVPTITFWFHFD